MSKADPDPIPVENINVEVIIESPEWNSCDFDLSTFTTDIISKTLHQVNFFDSVNKVELSVKLTSNDETQELNRNYRNLDKPASVLSFPSYELKAGDITELSGQDEVYLGDIALGYEKVYNASLERDISFKNHYTHLLVHSILHILGYEHDDENDAKQMEGLEIAILKTMGVKNPYEIN